MIEIGGYILDVNEMTLSRDGNSVKLEPKVLEVLSYFCENENRYISMSELHENVWKNRCVSDAAVRRSIGKLRQLFNDDHKDPSFIQSLPKRGYKLICQVSFLANESESSDPLPINHHSSPTQENDFKADIVTKLLYSQNKTIFFLLIIIIILFFITPIVYGVYNNIAMVQTEHHVFSGSNKFSLILQKDA
ncbi:MAG: winged helix-turn-helix domain-containing protein [Colwellia sp.]|nr:winged helix-turn-helix domain-containing protein [Colwellia sp.]